MKTTDVTTSTEPEVNDLLLPIGHVFNALESSGWYAFCLGGSGSIEDLAQCKLYLVIEDKGHRVVHSLPLICNAKHEEATPVWSLDYGMRVYATKTSTVQVVGDSSWKNHPNPHQQQQQKQNVSFRWKWIPRHTDEDALPASAGHVSSDRKALVCATCAKTFARVRAAQTHCNDMHKVPESDSIWAQPLEILYNDEDMAIVDKPQGISVQGGAGKTLQRSNLLLPLSTERKPIIVHRLDGPTGGCLVVAKHKKAEVALRKSFANHGSCQKRYRAVVFGKIEEEEGTISERIGGKTSVTRYQVIRQTRCTDDRAKGGWITTVDCYPVTGRRHQIRKHMKHIGHAIWGDKRYGWYANKHDGQSSDVLLEEEKLDRLHKTSVQEDPHARLCLWAMEITVPHPTTGSPVRAMLTEEPKWITQLLDYEEKLYFASNLTK